jgi:hypothetical protein
VSLTNPQRKKSHGVRSVERGALQTITADTLHRVWDEFDYRDIVVRVAQCAQIEGLCLMHDKRGQLLLLTVYVVPV